MSPSAEDSRVVAGRYRLRSVLGSGSMGTVWSAYDEFLHRPVAVKEVRLPPGVLQTQADELRERTLREARAIAVLSHPNVIILHDVARENGEPFVVMELLPSHSLATLTRDHGPLQVGQAAAIGDAVAAALEAAHAAGITHRDVKPGNVLVAEDGRIKLTDFGIARNVSEATMTSTGMMLGSPAYIAPEVASGGEVTHAADLWGLGATLFSVTEGRPPYDVDGDPLQTVTEVVHGDVPAPSPGPLAPVISGLMAKEPKDRLTLPEVRRRLRPLLANLSDPLFAPELFTGPAKPRDPDHVDGGDTQVIEPIPPAEPAPEKKPGSSDTGAPALAADPGPLPFAVDPMPPVSPGGPVAAAPGRSALAGAALTIAAVLLFLAAAAGGFALTRTLGGQSLEPPVETSGSGPAAPPLQALATRSGDATNVKGTTGGLFNVEVPRDWTEFVTQEPGRVLPPSTLVQYVSVDGRQELSVERFAAFFPNFNIDAYVAGVKAEWAASQYRATEYLPTPGASDDLLFTYQTRENAPGWDGGELARTTFEHVFRRGSSLWVVRVTVPTEQEESGRRELFERIKPTFDPED